MYELFSSEAAILTFPIFLGTKVLKSTKCTLKNAMFYETNFGRYIMEF